jgi:hypothetical protein
MAPTRLRKSSLWELGGLDSAQRSTWQSKVPAMTRCQCWPLQKGPCLNKRARSANDTMMYHAAVSGWCRCTRAHHKHITERPGRALHRSVAAITLAGFDVTLLDASPNPGGLSAGWRTKDGKAVEAGMKGFWYQVCLHVAPPRHVRTHTHGSCTTPPGPGGAL